MDLTKYKFIVFNDNCFKCNFTSGVVLENGLAYYKAKGSSVMWPLLEKEEDLRSRLLIEALLEAVKKYPRLLSNKNWDQAIEIEDHLEALGIEPLKKHLISLYNMVLHVPSL